MKWIKLDTDIFDDIKIKKIRRLPGGDKLLITWLYLLSQAGKCSAGGFIFITKEVPLDPEDIADISGIEIATVQLALKVFQELNMIELMEDGKIYVVNFAKHQNLEKLDMLKEQTKKRVAAYRERKKLEFSNAKCNDSGNEDVTQCNATDKTRLDKTRLDKNRLDKTRLEEDRDTPGIPYSEIVNILNAETGNNYKHTSKSTRNFIKARWNEGFRFSDFEKVIKAKCSQWKADPKMSIYLRPQTLFGTKFESYLQEYGKVTEGRKLKEYEKDYDAKYAGKDIFKTI